ncbi:NPHS1 [Cordylochernes scorpioides]|uniref:NPHS1 n=1 Tax=Cordylochernes scorpioides TaxID=51811 RepID=A0ABY6LP94_9ARAC|nr:NPHS1 [Cordylochernes scorpioides]
MSNLLNELIRYAVIYPEDREPLLRTCSTQKKNLITEIISAAIERARDSDPFVLPPKHVSINGLDDSSEVMVREADKLSLACTAEGSKPAATIDWYLRTIKLVPGVFKKTLSGGGFSQEAAKTTVLKGQDRRYTTVSSITLYPKMEQAGAVYTCEVNHPGLERPVRTSVTVGVFEKRVLFSVPPEVPQIRGYTPGTTVKAGDRLTLVCSTRGGRPAPTLLWLRGDTLADSSFATSAAGVTSNTFTFLVEPGHHGAVFRCEANNSGVARPLTASVRLHVL